MSETTPFDLVRAILGNEAMDRITADAERDRQAAIARQATVSSVTLLSRLIAESSTLDYQQALNGVCSVADNLIPLLDSPEGWRVISAHVTALGDPGASWLEPVRH